MPTSRTFTCSSPDALSLTLEVVFGVTDAAEVVTGLSTKPTELNAVFVKLSACHVRSDLYVLTVTSNKDISHLRLPHMAEQLTLGV